MANGEWVKGMDSALFTGTAADCGGCAAAVGCGCPWPLWNKWNFRLFHLFQQALLVDEAKSQKSQMSIYVCDFCSLFWIGLEFLYAVPSVLRLSVHHSPISLTTLLWPESSSRRSSESSPRSASASYLSVFGQMASAMVGTGGCTQYGLILPSSGPTPSLRIARLLCRSF